jgi:hypothetical protein
MEMPSSNPMYSTMKQAIAAHAMLNSLEHQQTRSGSWMSFGNMRMHCNDRFALPDPFIRE